MGNCASQQPRKPVRESVKRTKKITPPVVDVSKSQPNDEIVKAPEDVKTVIENDKKEKETKDNVTPEENNIKVRNESALFAPPPKNGSLVMTPILLNPKCLGLSVPISSFPVHTPELAAMSAAGSQISQVSSLEMSQTVFHLPRRPSSCPGSPVHLSMPGSPKFSSCQLSFDDAWVDKRLSSNQARQLLMRLADEELSMNRVESLYIEQEAERRRSIQFQRLLQNRSKLGERQSF
eukprot:TRINITY_DN23533_c0_g1_i1.p1 TRINITY_DN23533_c0_g1~~TRINITY_DN23533_c0_g1_i1.p1  ORF type:complete len:235 (+),score=44.44 TRINITY_DN23533_c0_g1_i1:57-761(+)